MNLNDLLKTKAAQDPINRAAISAAARSLGAVTPGQRKQVSVSALVTATPARSRSKRGVGFVITITSYSRRVTDDDNRSVGAGSAKNLRDAIAASLGVDDADKRLKWEYRQQQTAGAEGTLVTISRVCTRR